MKKILIIFSFIFCSFLSFGQTASITGTIQDLSGQTFNNGTCIVNFVPNPNSPNPNQYNVSGASFNLIPSCAINGSGVISATVTRNDLIAPSGSQWAFIVSPNANSQSYILTTTISAASADLTSQFAGVITSNISVNASQTFPRAYKDSELILTPNAGQSYWDVTLGLLKIWDGSVFQQMPTSGGNPSFNNVTVNGTLIVNGTGGINAGTNSLTAGAATLDRIKNVCNVPSTAYSTIGAAYTDSTNCGAVYVWPNSATGYTETLSANLALTRSSVPIVFMGPATITMGTNQITAAGTVNGVSIVGMCGLSSGGNQCVKFVYTGTSAAIAIGDSSTHSKSLLIRGIEVSTTGNGAIGLQINNLDQCSVEDSYISQDGGASPIGIQTVGTGTFVGSCAFYNVHIVGAATNGIGYQFKNLSTNMQIVGGNVALDSGSSAVCIDVQGASTQSIEPVYVNLNTCNTAVKVESTATATGAIVGVIRTDSGVTTVANYASGTTGNKLTCTDCATNAAVTDSGSNNSLEVVLQNQINSRFNAIVSSSSGYSISEPTPNKSWLVHSAGGDTNLDALGVGGTVHIGHSAGGTGGLSIENGTGTAGATISGTGAAVFNASVQVNGGTVFTGSVGSGTKIASNSAVQTFEYGCTGTATAASTIILNNTLTGPTCTGTSAARPLTKISSAGTIVNLFAACTTGGVSASSGVVTVRRNGSASVLTCTLGTGTTCSDTTHSFAVGAGDELNLQFTTQSAETLANCEFSFEKQ